MSWQNADDVANHLKERLTRGRDLWAGEDLEVIVNRVAQLYVMDPGGGEWRVEQADLEPGPGEQLVHQVTRSGRPDPIYQSEEPPRARTIADVLNEIEQLRRGDLGQPRAPRP